MQEGQTISADFYTPERFAAMDRGIARSRVAFHCYAGAFVIVAAFLFGLSNGLSRKLPRAYASITPAEAFSHIAKRSGGPPSVPHALSGITPIPVGDDILINGKPGATMMFYSEQGVKDVVNGQIELWRSVGLKAAGMSSSANGSALAFDEQSKDRYTITAWRTKGKLTSLGEPEPPVQGIISYLKAGVSIHATPEEIRGEVPGVSPMPGASLGSLFSALDPGGRSYTGSYTNPATLSDTFNYYQVLLTTAGWSIALADHTDTIGTMRVIKGREQVMILFNKVRGDSSEGEKTLATITRSPREEEVAG